MKPIDFPEKNVIFGRNQPEYLPLPAYRRVNGEVTTCWKLSWREVLRLLFTRKLWLRQLTFNKPLQPQLPRVDCPFVDESPDRDRVGAIHGRRANGNRQASDREDKKAP
jgi:hypothetical protein